MSDADSGVPFSSGPCTIPMEVQLTMRATSLAAPGASESSRASEAAPVSLAIAASPFGPFQGAVGDENLGCPNAGQSVDHSSGGTSGTEHQHILTAWLEASSLAKGAQKPYAVGVVSGKVAVPIHNGVDRSRRWRPSHRPGQGTE